MSSDDEISIGVFVAEIEEEDEEEGGWRGVVRRDKYGFELEDDYSETHIRHALRSCSFEEESQMVWRNLFTSYNSFEEFPPPAKLHPIIRKYGIPPEFRPQVSYESILIKISFSFLYFLQIWWYSCQITSKHWYSSDGYHALVQKQLEQNTNSFQDQIERDLRRTFPGHALFDTRDGIGKLRRILLAFSCFNDDIGYCQSMNFISAFLLLVFEEEKAFWMLVYIIEELLPPQFYTTNMLAAVVDQVYSFFFIYSLFLLFIFSIF